MEVYLDAAAATPVNKFVFEAMVPYFSDKFYNPSSPYLPAKHLKSEYENAKDILAHAIGAKGEDIIITAGATEANNLAFTVLQSVKNDYNLDNLPKCLVLSTEHDSVLKIAKHTENYALIDVDKNGRIILDDLRKKIDDQTVLISVSTVNNELGTIQPISEIAEIIKEIRLLRLSKNNKLPLYLHSDASQALNLMDLSVSRMNVDMLTINSAKIYGPKGIGAIYVKQGIRLCPIIFGGGQENGLRSGTENVPNLIGFSMASKLAKEHNNGFRKHAEEIKNLFKSELKNNLANHNIFEASSNDDDTVSYKFLGNEKYQLANFISVCFDGIDAERLIYLLEDEGIYLSTGAACAASKGERSHVLKAIGLTETEIAGSIRISFLSSITEEQAKYAAQKIADAVAIEKIRIQK